MQPGNGLGDQDRRSFIETARRAQIVRSAIETIAEVGYPKASFVRIGKHAGVSAALISYHFASRNELITQVVSDVVGAMDGAARAAHGAGSAAAALSAVVEAQVRFFAEHPAEVRALEAIRGSAEPGVADAAWAERDRSLAAIGELLAAGQRAGEFRRCDTRVLAATVLAALEAVPAQLRATPDLDADTYAGELVALIDAATRR